MSESFAFEFDDSFASLLSITGIRPDNSHVVITDDDRFVASFGRWQVDTPLANVTGTLITRDYRWYRAIGVRGSLRDRGLTFGSNTDTGLCVEFAEPVRLLLKWRHPALTVTVGDPEALQAAIEARIG